MLRLLVFFRVTLCILRVALGCVHMLTYKLESKVVHLEIKETLQNIDKAA